MGHSLISSGVRLLLKRGGNLVSAICRLDVSRVTVGQIRPARNGNHAPLRFAAVDADQFPARPANISCTPQYSNWVTRGKNLASEVEFMIGNC